MTNKISYDEYLKMLMNIDVSDEEISAYIQPVRPEEPQAFQISIGPNPELVVMTEEELEMEGGLSLGNKIARWRRNKRFKRRLKNSAYDDWPVIVSEGDSWFQFPFLITEVVDHLCENYLINSLGAAGDTAENMLTGPYKKGGQEYFRALKKQVATGRLHGFLLSAAGNDVIGKDVSGKRNLAKHLLDNGDVNNPESFVNKNILETTLNTLGEYYKDVIDKMENDSDLKDVPIFIHGYDYCYPGGHPNDPRKNQIYASRDQWLGGAFKEAGINIGRDKEREVIIYMIDRLYEMMAELSTNNEHVHLVDVRGSLPSITDWKDEIHGTSEGFGVVAQKFDEKIQSVIS